jgi:nucleoside diphosphate kinase
MPDFTPVTYTSPSRAVKFIRDQAAVSLAALQSQKKPLGAMLGVTNPANALRKMLKPDHSPRISVLFADETASRGPSMGSFDPLNGWSDGVSLEKSHFCLLIKPQVVLRSSTSDSSVCLLAATQASAQVFALMDQTNADDPVSGKIMTRYATSISLSSVCGC